MKKHFWKRLMTIGLTIIMTLSICGCGNENKEENKGSSSGGKADANSALAKECVYRVQNIELPQMYESSNGNVNMMGLSHINGNVYALLQINDWNNYSEYDYRLLSMKEDGSEIQVVNLEFPGISDETDDSGDETDEEDTTEVTDEQGGVAIEPRAVEGLDTDYNSNVWEYTGYSNFVLTPDGVVYGVKTYNYEDYSDPENFISKRETYICSWGMDGSFLWEQEMAALKTENVDEWIYLNTMLRGKDGALYVIMGGDKFYKAKIETDGTVSDKILLSEDSLSILTNCDRIIPRDDGSAYVIYRDIDNYDKVYQAEYDITTEAVTNQKEIPSNIMYNWDYNVMIPGISSDLIFTSNGSIRQYNDGDTESTVKMDFINSDLYISSFLGLVELSDQSFIGFYNEDWSTVKAGLFTYVAPEDIKDKAVLIVAGQWIDSTIRQRVVEFNRSNPDYKIVVKDYSQYNSYDDYQAGINKLNNDIITGGMPDILIAQGLPVDNYIAKGLIADIGKLISEDEELSKVEFMQNVFDAYSVNNKLYYIVPDFQINTVLAKKSLVGDKDVWNMETMKQVVAGMGPEASAFGDQITRAEFIQMAMQYCGGDFVDLSSGKCSFDSPDFIAILEYAKSLPVEINYEGNESYWDDYWMNYQSQYRENRTLLMQTSLYGFQYISNVLNGSFGEEVSFVGFPTESGKGSAVNCYSTYVLSSKSKNLDAAWSFMRYYLTEEYQKNMSFPVRKDLLLEKSKEALERPYWEDENGEKQYYDNTITINGEEVVIDPLNQQQLDQVISFMESVTGRYYYDENVMNILNEEIEGYFSGQKTAQDVASIIQSRVQIYVDENR